MPELHEPRAGIERAPALATRDWQGAQSCFVRRRDGARADSLRPLVERPTRFDREGVRAAWGLGARDSGAPPSVLAGIHHAPRASLPLASRALGESFLSALEEESGRLRAVRGFAALALGGGLDAALVLAGLRAVDAPLPALLTLETGLDGYDEVERAQAIARHFGKPLEIVRAAPGALAALLPRAVSLAETPLHGLHPVGRLALAQAAQARGCAVLFTGDGADAACRGAPDLDYVPIVASLTRGAGLRLASPFFDAQVIAAARDPAEGKEKLRALATALGLPAWITDAPKRARAMPPIDRALFARWEDRAQLERLALQLGEPLRLDSERAALSWITLGLLARALEEV